MPFFASSRTWGLERPEDRASTGTPPMPAAVMQLGPLEAKGLPRPSIDPFAAA